MYKTHICASLGSDERMFHKWLFVRDTVV